MVTAGDIIGGGFRLIRERIGAVAIWVLLYLAVNVAMVFFMRPVMQQLMALQAGGAAPDPAALLGTMGHIYGLNVLVLLALLVVYTAALRAALRPEEDSFAYLRIGMDELRMLVVAALLTIVFFVALLVFSLVIGLLVGIAVVGGGGVGVVLIMVPLLFGLMAVAVFFQIRFSLVFPLTVLRRRIVIGESWRLTKGRFWMLFGAYLVVGLIVFAIFALVGTVTTGPYFAEMARNGFTPEGMRIAQQHQVERQFGTVDALTVIGWVLSALGGTCWIALGAGAAGTAAAGLLHDDFADIGAIYE